MGLVDKLASSRATKWSSTPRRSARALFVVAIYESSTWIADSGAVGHLPMGAGPTAPWHPHRCSCAVVPRVPGRRRRSDQLNIRPVRRWARKLIGCTARWTLKREPRRDCVSHSIRHPPPPSSPASPPCAASHAEPRASLQIAKIKASSGTRAGRARAGQRDEEKAHRRSMKGVRACVSCPRASSARGVHSRRSAVRRFFCCWCLACRQRRLIGGEQTPPRDQRPATPAVGDDRTHAEYDRVRAPQTAMLDGHCEQPMRTAAAAATRPTAARTMRTWRMRKTRS